MEKKAILSDDGRYRYWLERRWDLRPPMAWCMLNPSTADAYKDDPTIRRCMAFAEREGFGGIIVVNLMAFRATEPSVCLAQADPYGPENEYYLAQAAQKSGRGIVCAWGAHGTRQMANVAVKAFGDVELWCLGVTKSGEPRHPLYLAESTPFTRWNRR